MFQATIFNRIAVHEIYYIRKKSLNVQATESSSDFIVYS